VFVTTLRVNGILGLAMRGGGWKLPRELWIYYLEFVGDVASWGVGEIASKMFVSHKRL
jgi:hypothetical protein